MFLNVCRIKIKLNSWIVLYITLFLTTTVYLTRMKTNHASCARTSSIFKIIFTNCVARLICCFFPIKVSITCCSRISEEKTTTKYIIGVSNWPLCSYSKIDIASRNCCGERGKNLSLVNAIATSLFSSSATSEWSPMQFFVPWTLIAITYARWHLYTDGTKFQSN